MPTRLATLVLLALLAACDRGVDRDVIPKGDGWECYLDRCDRQCSELAALQGETCTRHKEAYCVTAVDDDDPAGISYCSPVFPPCERIQRGWTSGKLGDGSVRKVSRCESIP